MKRYTVKTRLPMNAMGGNQVGTDTIDATRFAHEHEFTLFYGEGTETVPGSTSERNRVVASYRNADVISIRLEGELADNGRVEIDDGIIKPVLEFDDACTVVELVIREYNMNGKPIAELAKGIVAGLNSRGRVIA